MTLRGTLRFIVLLVVLSHTSAATLRSPKDAASQPKKIAKMAPGIAALIPPTPKAAIIIKPPWFGPYHITVTWDDWGAIGRTDYALYVSSNTAPFHIRLTTTNNWLTVSNLWHPGFYELTVAAIDAYGVEGFQSPPVRWPQPQTNYFSLGVSATLTGSWTTNSTFTNPPSPQFYRLQRQPTAYQLKTSTNLKQWSDAVTWPATNPPTTFYLRSKYWDNVSGIEHRDR